MTPAKSINRGYLFAAAATALWAGNFIIARGLKNDIGPVTLAFWRWTVACMVLAPIAAPAVVRELKVIRQNIGYLVVTSLLGITTFNTLLYVAGQTTTVINISLISITFPIFVVLISRVVYGEEVGPNKWAGIALVLCGVVWLITKGELERLQGLSFAVGDLWMLSAAFVFAVYSILLKKKPPELGVGAFQLSSFIIGLAMLLPVFIWEQMTAPAASYTDEVLMAILYVGVCASLVAYLCWNKAVMALGPAKAGMVYYTAPVFSTLLAWVLLGERVGVLHLASAALILAGIVLANRSGGSAETAGA